AALVLPAESRRWPGFLARLLENEQDGVVIAPAGLAAVAASLQTAIDEFPKLRRHVARLADHSLATDVEYVSSANVSPGRALPVTHILFGGDSMRFPDGGVVIGTEEVSNVPHIALPRAAAGVSRRHCSLRRDGERTMLVDHSRYGTWVNGARVRERAAVRPGDRVRVGTPGVEFTLISAAAVGRGGSP
ncbi:MAG: FHA domain-containing protein, partial [Steroidobacteraceae bacterium]|nr:FHA domain-containing protein [Steroidobacteraceae bacterium]